MVGGIVFHKHIFYLHFVSAVINKILRNGTGKIFLWLGHLLDYYKMKILV